ncbi:hypothetical protein GCM10009839_17710 [Catenulispora yoronensis]|uniref:HTH cro/C1-type domain-containing protein n=1 Tax=Catenulispora yoronensis TaxID=450799 RepID=A0ABN2TUI2_9ACTN
MAGIAHGNRQQREQLRRKMEDANCPPQQIADEMIIRWRFRPRQAWRHAYGWTQDEVAARYNSATGNSAAPMTGKRISDYEAWPFGGVKPSLNALAILADIYTTHPWRLVDFTDREAMTSSDRIALDPQRQLRVSFKSEQDLKHDQSLITNSATPGLTNYGLDDLVRVGEVLYLIFDEFATYTNCYLDLVTRDTYSHREINELLQILNGLIRKFVSPDAGWIDVAVPVAINGPMAATPLVEGLKDDTRWLQVLYSSVRRTSRPILIPIEVNGTPWRGSGNAFVSQGMDYVGRFGGLYRGIEYDLPADTLEKIESRYEYWREECYFAALLALAILSPDKESQESIGVLNINFLREDPIGFNDTLSPQKSVAVVNLLEPALQVLARAIEKQTQQKGDRS